jgi:hypothetical protein
MRGKEGSGRKTKVSLPKLSGNHVQETKEEKDEKANE